jgi:hypothetical protein
VKSASDCLELASDEVVLAAALGSNACPSRQPPAESLDARQWLLLCVTEESCFQEGLVKRATGLEPATSSLEGWRSTN